MGMATKKRDGPETPAMFMSYRRKTRERDPLEAAFNREFGARLRKARDARDKSQKDMATALGIGVDQYKKHELGETAFPPYLLQRLRGIIDYSILDMIMTDNSANTILFEVKQTPHHSKPPSKPRK